MKITQMFSGIHYFLLSKNKLHFMFLFLTSIFKISSYIYIKEKAKLAVVSISSFLFVLKIKVQSYKKIRIWSDL